MELMSGYYRQNDDSLSLLLQQYVCGGVPICLGCICGGEKREAGIRGGSITGWLLKGFRRMHLCKVVRKPDTFLKKLERNLKIYWEEYCASQDFWTAGIMCIGSDFLLFYRGAVRLFLCNTYFGHPSLQLIGENEQSESEELRFRRGRMESDIGILLASESFCQKLSMGELRNCLAVQDITDASQTQKRIKELGSAAEKKGSRNMAALLLEIR